MGKIKDRGLDVCKDAAWYKDRTKRFISHFIQPIKVIGYKAGIYQKIYYCCEIKKGEKVVYFIVVILPQALHFPLLFFISSLMPHSHIHPFILAGLPNTSA